MIEEILERVGWIVDLLLGYQAQRVLKLQNLLASNNPFKIQIVLEGEFCGGESDQ